MNNNLHWATNKEIKERLEELDFNKELDKSGIPLYSEGNKIYLDKSPAHNLIIGCAGSGKTQSIILPMLRTSMFAKESFVINDPNGELYEKCAHNLKENGYNVLALDFYKAEYGNNWNPLKEIYNYYNNDNSDLAIKMLEDLAYYIFYEKSNLNVDPFWINTSIDYFTGLVLYLFENAKEEEVNFQSIYNLSTYLNTKGNTEKFLEKIDKASEIYINLSGTLKAPPETRGSIMAVFSQKIKRYISRKNITNMLCGNDIELKDIINKPTAVFILSGSSSFSNSLIPLLVTQIIECAREENNKKRINILLDEFDSMVPIKDFARVINNCQSLNIRFTITINSYAHLEFMYTKDDAALLKYCFANTIYLLSEDINTLEEISKYCGSTNNGPLITVEELKVLKTFEAVISMIRMMPIKTKLIPDYKTKWPFEEKQEKIPIRMENNIKIYEI